MQDISNQIHKFLIKKQKTVAIAESCTGGLVSTLLTKIPGSSKYFILGTVTYSNKSKEDILKIPRKVITQNGAVSGIVARLMAKNIRKISGADFGIGITGIAGPGGAMPSKPVGTVFIAMESKKMALCKKFCFSGDRARVRKKAALASLKLLYSALVYETRAKP
jgi:PncC family amidohydrolase